MAQSIFITSAEGHSGKSTVALGVLDALSRATPRVGVFRPIARSTAERDYVLEMLLDHDGVDLDYDECVGVTYDDVRSDPDAALSTIVERYKAVEAQCDAVVIVGSDYTDVGSPAELGYNARIAANLGAPVLLVLERPGGAGSEQLGTSPARTPGEMGQIAALALAELVNGRAGLLAVIANRVDPDAARRGRRRRSVVDAAIASGRPSPTAGARLGAAGGPLPRRARGPRCHAHARRATLIKGDQELLAREVLGVVIAGMSMVNVLPRLFEGSLVIIPADRTEVLLAALLAHRVGHVPVARRHRAQRPVPAARRHRPADRRPRRDAPDPLDRPRHLRDGAEGHVDARPPRRRLAAPLRHGARHVRDPRRHRGARQLAGARAGRRS